MPDQGRAEPHVVVNAYRCPKPDCGTFMASRDACPRCGRHGVLLCQDIRTTHFVFEHPRGLILGGLYLGKKGWERRRQEVACKPGRSQPRCMFTATAAHVTCDKCRATEAFQKADKSEPKLYVAPKPLRELNHGP